MHNYIITYLLNNSFLHKIVQVFQSSYLSFEQYKKLNFKKEKSEFIEEYKLLNYKITILIF